MAQDTSNKSRNQSGGIAKSSHRGNMDEYEAVRTIVSENPGLLMRVLEKIRAARNGDANQKTNTPKKDDDKNQKKK
jgi:hypothetical protein